MPPAELTALRERLRATIISLVERGVCYFGSGAALGFDLLAAEVVLELRELYPHIKLIMVLPCHNQSRGWPTDGIALYERVLAAADKVVCLAEHYYSGCMHKRNRHLVDASGYCICYHTKPSGGTAYTVSYAKEQGLEIYNVA